jgi:hypothetical protein
MTDKKNEKDVEEIDLGSEGFPVAIAIRTSENSQTGEKRMLITIRAGTGAKDIQFNFGNYGSGGGGVTTMGGDPGSPPCP